MRRVFADAFYWIALTDPHDRAYPEALTFSRNLNGITVVTTEPVLVELMYFFSEQGPHMRKRALTTATIALQSPGVQVIPHSDTTLQRALDFYAARMDKGYSLTDCISMLCMREEGIFEVLTGDAHFAQEGFVPLLQRT